MPSWLSRRPSLVDAALAGCLCILDLLLSLGSIRNGPNGLPATAAYSAAGYAALAWRRRKPVPVFAIAVAHSLLAWVLAPDYTPTLSVWVSLYTVAARSRPRVAVLALLVSFGPAFENVAHEVQVAVTRDRLNTMIVAGLAGVLFDCAVFGVGLWAGWSFRQRGLVAEQAAAAAAAAERGRIARELHDVVAHSVTLMLLQAGGAARLLSTDPARSRAALDHVDVLGQQALVELRRMLALLRLNTNGTGEPSTSPPGADMIADLVAQMTTGRLPVRLEIVGDSRPLEPGVDVSAYRIVQESLTNASRYAADDHPVSVRVTWSTDVVELLIVNRVPLTEPSAAGRRMSSGYGVLGMTERVSALGGELDVGRQADDTFRVRATLPVTVPAPKSPGVVLAVGGSGG